MSERKQHFRAKKSSGNSASALGAPRWVTPELIEHTLKVWQPYYEQELSSDDALEILEGAAGIIEVPFDRSRANTLIH